MSIVIVGGEVRPDDAIVVELPSSTHRPLEVV
jgi:MOSC domain-containing protein YiiM